MKEETALSGPGTKWQQGTGMAPGDRIVGRQHRAGRRKGAEGESHTDAMTHTKTVLRQICSLIH